MLLCVLLLYATVCRHVTIACDGACVRTFSDAQLYVTVGMYVPIIIACYTVHVYVRFLTLPVRGAIC